MRFNTYNDNIAKIRLIEVKNIIGLILFAIILSGNRMPIILFLVLVFNLQSWAKADDIKDFEIEGISIGDSLLEYFNRNEFLFEAIPINLTFYGI